MSREPFQAPDVLVLAGGGVLGEAWMSGVVGGLEDAGGPDLRRVETIVGTSAGSIVGASLAAGRAVRRPAAAGGRVGGADDDAGEFPDAGCGADGDGAAGADRMATAGEGRARAAANAAARLAATAVSPLVDPLLALGAPGGAVARAAVLARVPAGTRRLDGLAGWLERAGATFDGRLRVCCVDRASGKRVVFGAPGSPPASVAAAVMASCAIPGVFAPVTIGGREYVDGGAWSQTNIDAAPVGRATRVLCLNPVLGLPASLGGAWGALHSAWRARARIEVLALRRRGAVVRMIGPSPEAVELIGPELMNAAPRDAVLAAGHRQGAELARG